MRWYINLFAAVVFGASVSAQAQETDTSIPQDDATTSPADGTDGSDTASSTTLPDRDIVVEKEKGPDDPLGWGLIFTLDGLGDFNIGALDSLGVGGYKMLGDDGDTWIRGGISFDHSPNPVTIQRDETLTGPEEIVEFQQTEPTYTSTTDLVLRADLIRKLADRGAISPYGGAGVAYRLDLDRTSWTDDVTAELLEENQDRLDITHTLTLRGVLGALWDVHEAISVFAEFGLDVQVLQQQNRRTTNVDSTRAPDENGGSSDADTTSINTVTSRRAIWLDTDTPARFVNGRLGVMVKF